MSRLLKKICFCARMWERLRHWGRLTPEGLVNANMETLAGTTSYYSQNTSQQKSCSKTFCKTFSCKTFWNFFWLVPTWQLGTFWKEQSDARCCNNQLQGLEDNCWVQIFPPKTFKISTSGEAAAVFPGAAPGGSKGFPGTAGGAKDWPLWPWDGRKPPGRLFRGKNSWVKTNLGWKLSGGHLQGW